MPLSSEDIDWTELEELEDAGCVFKINSIPEHLGKHLTQFLQNSDKVTVDMFRFLADQAIDAFARAEDCENGLAHVSDLEGSIYHALKSFEVELFLTLEKDLEVQFAQACLHAIAQAECVEL